MSKYSLYGVVIIFIIALVAAVIRNMPAEPGPVIPADPVLGERHDSALQFYHLMNVQTPNNPLAKWKMASNGGVGSSYVFTNANGEVIDSIKDPKGVLEKVVDVKNNKPVLRGLDIMPNAHASLDPAEGNIVLIEFTPEGRRKFEVFTRKNIDEYLAVFFEGKLITAPSIKVAITGGKAQISGFASMEESKKAANMLNFSEEK